METSTNIKEISLNDLDGMTIWFNNKMTIFKITDDTKTFIKEYIEMNNKDITQWIVSENIMSIFNITPETQKNVIDYIITKNNELSNNKIKKMDCFMSIEESTMFIPDQY